MPGDGERNLLRIGKSIIAPCRTGTPFLWNGKFNDDPASGSEKEYIRPLGPMPPIMPIRKSSAPAAAAGLWSGKDTAYWSYAYIFENGEIGRPVGEMNVTGNLRDLFSRLEMVGNDVYPYSSTLSPSLVFADVDFSGV